jgi:hypothetical protein
MPENHTLQAKKMRSKVFSHMLKSRGKKYYSFLFYLRFFKYIAFAPLRGKFLESYYTLMRYLDDIVDGDAELPNDYLVESDYIKDKLKFLDNPVNPTDDADFMILYCSSLARKFNEEFTDETRDILESLLFDAMRRGKYSILSKDDLSRHFHLMDIRGTIRATLKIFRDDPEKYRFLEPLGIACRHQYNLEDFDADIAAGYINISREECERFGIRHEEIHISSSMPVRSWKKHHATEGMSLLSEHHRQMPNGNFSILQKAIFRVVYEMPAKRTFRKILSAYAIE